MQPEFIDGDSTLILEGVGPFATMFVLLVFPFRADAFFEEVVVGFEAEFGGGSDVVLNRYQYWTLGRTYRKEKLT